MPKGVLERTLKKTAQAGGEPWSFRGHYRSGLKDFEVALSGARNLEGMFSKEG